MKIDTGAQANILTYKDFNSVNKSRKVKLNPVKETLRGYSGKPLNTKGKCMLTVNYGSKKCVALFYVCEGPKNSLLGRGLSEKLDVVRLNLDSVETVAGQNSSHIDYDDLKGEYSDIFKGLGCMPGVHHIVIDKSVPPVVHACRKVPFPLHDKLKTELERMVSLGVLAKVDKPTDWVSSLVMVKKPNGKLRVCLDPRDLNRAIKRQHFKLPTREEIMAKFSTCKIFSKIDASQEFWQMALDEPSSYLTTFNTPFGRYRYLRLPYGVKSAPEVYHKHVASIFQGIDGVHTEMDDVIIAAKSHSQHDQALIQVLKRARENNLKLNSDKCQFGVSKLIFLGDLLTDTGIRPDPSKVSAIVNFEKPVDKKGIQRLLGMVNYLGKWVANLSTITEPLRKLLVKDIQWEWSFEQEKAFVEIKEILSKEPILEYYNPNRPIKISSDASKSGLGAVLYQLVENEWRVIAYASRAMTGAETHYAQIEKELLSIAFACSRFHQYIYGTTVKCETDHKPLIPIFRKPLADCPLRIQRLLLTIQRYDLEVSFIPGKELIPADALSRAYEQNCRTGDTEGDGVDLYINDVIKLMPFSDNRLGSISEKSAEDSQFMVLKNIILRGWPNEHSDCPTEILEYWGYRDELSVSGNLIFKGSRLVIPKLARSDILVKIHEGHMGIEKCRKRAREVVFWPGINNDIKVMVQNCSSCIKYSSKACAEPLKPHDFPLRPWQRTGVDLFSHRNRNYLVIADYFSFYPEVIHLSSICTKAVINGLKSVFARYGVCDVMVSDNGPQFSSNEFSQFAKDWQFQHITSSPHFPSSNGLAESAVKSVKYMIMKCIDSDDDIYKALLAYRTTPLSYGKSPAQVLFNRRIKGTLPVTHALLKHDDDIAILNKRLGEKVKVKNRYDQSAQTLKPLLPTQQVVLYNHRLNQYDTPATVLQEVSPRSYLVESENGVKYRRNRRMMKPVRFNPNQHVNKCASEESDIESEDTDDRQIEDTGTLGNKSTGCGGKCSWQQCVKKDN